MSLPQYIDSLHQTTLDLLRYRDINQLMPQIIERAVKLIGGDRGFVYLVDPDTQVMRQSAAYGFKERFYDDIVVTKGVGITGIVWQTRQTQIVYNYHQWAHRISNLHEPVRHIAAVPLILDDEVVGVISVLKDAPDAVYTEADMKILASFADLSAVAIENSRLYSELQQSEHFKQKITNLMPDIVYVYDLIEQRNIYANLALERVLGTTQAQIYQQSFEGLSTYVHPDDLPKIVEHLKKIQRGEATDVVFEMRLKDKHGVWRWFQNHITLFHWDEAGNLTQILGVLQDVHDRKQAEESLRQTESRFRTLIEHAPEAIFVYDADTGFIVHANQNAIQQFGYSLEQLKQMTPMDLVRLPEDDNRDLTKLTLNVVRRTLRGETPVISAQGQTASGDVRYFELRLVSLPGDKPLLRVSALDITDRMKAERALKESESRFRQLMEVLPVGVFIYQNDELAYINPYGKALSGYEIGKPIQEQLWDLLHPESRYDIASHIITFADTGEFPNRLEIRAYDSQNNLRWFDIHLAQFRLNNAPAVLGVLVDVTERKMAQQNAVALLLEKERVKLLADFVQDASHDFRTPLSSINTSAYLLSRLDNWADEEKRQYHLEMIKTQVKQLDKLVNGLLTLSQLDSGIPFDFKPNRIPVLFGELQTAMIEAATQKGLTLHFEHADNLPLVVMDHVQIFQALRQILMNAVRHTPPGGKIFVSAHVDDDNLFIRIQDTGVGIAPENLSRVFDRFYRGEESQMAGGLGLGLSIARKIVEYHQGDVMVESVLGEGSTFTVRLPIGDEYA